MDCFKCLSVWVALPFAFFVGGQPLETLVSWLGLSGAAILLEQQIPEPLIIEAERKDELLRSEPMEHDRSAGEEN